MARARRQEARMCTDTDWDLSGATEDRWDNLLLLLPCPFTAPSFNTESARINRGCRVYPRKGFQKHTAKNKAHQKPKVPPREVQTSEEKDWVRPLSISVRRRPSTPEPRKMSMRNSTRRQSKVGQARPQTAVGSESRKMRKEELSEQRRSIDDKLWISDI